MDDFSLLDFFWLMLWFFLFVAWIWLLVSLLTDVFRSKDISGWVKALWVLFIIVLPLIGALVYLIARGSGMAKRTAEEYQEREQQFREYVRDAAGSGSGDGGASTADELTKLAQLRDAGTLTEEEFNAQKAKLLS